MLKNRFGKVVLAVDKFKGSLTSQEVAASIRKGLENNPFISVGKILSFPMADGGDGSLEVMEQSLGRNRTKRVTVSVTDPLGRPVEADYLMIDGKTAFIEMAGTSGLVLLQENERNPDRTTTYGTGEMMRHAIVESGARRLVVAIGGSATNDGGLGMLTALGFRFRSRAHFPTGKVSDLLASLTGLDDSLVEETVPGWKKVDVQVAVDVKNPLLGENGATRIYGPQKGGSPEMLERLEAGMANWADVVCRWRGDGRDLASLPGTGAAGGMGFALSAVFGAVLLPGWKLFSDTCGLEREISDADLVITAEGKFDGQSLSGKLPSGVMQLCRKYGRPLWIVCGRCEVSAAQAVKDEAERLLSLEKIEPDLKKSMDAAAGLLQHLIENQAF